MPPDPDGRPAPSAPHAAALFVYPFKSAGGIGVSEVEVDAVGLRDDRRWMAVDEHGRFVSQRPRPQMALLRTRLLADALELTAADRGPLRLPRAEPDAARFGSHRVWFSDRYTVDCGDDAARWMSDFLGLPSRVMRAVRPGGQPPLTDDGHVRAGFADASPALVVSTASLAELNRRLDLPLPMDRFRPNIVVAGFGPFEEDRWGARRVGEVRTRGGKPCPRCATTLVDQSTGERGLEPLRTLATFRRNPAGEVEFGVNVFFETGGVVRVGDPIG
ncbi:MAG TPA: MOSC N-terminal beta barrel domain-containing protein [Longimicrobiales bacterium]|nr:MOSC N-terminal beta barrel domain-containing protein [Longimicrobiales bacterium]